VRSVPRFACGVPTATVVVDDGSDDRTAQRAARAGALVIRHRDNQGGGAALRTGYELALEVGARYVVTLDGDGQHLPHEMSTLLEPLVSGSADLVVGSRVIGSSEPGKLARELGIVAFNRLVSGLLRRRFTDCSNGYRAIRTSALRDLELRQDQFHAAEFLIEAVTRGVTTVEVPVTVRARQHGETKKPRTLAYGAGFANAILKAWLRARSRARTSRHSARTLPSQEPSAAERQSA
jgi:glycosyltransferase involved in cell wall biosynthesis